MGLDMYLTAKRYVWKSRDDDHSLQDKLNEVMADELEDGMRVNEVSVDAMYWRKANAIHQWFVENVQEGEDNCREYWVDSAQLEKLLEVCKFALEHKDCPEDILPTQEGFFFGSNEYDDWYWDEINRTIEGLEKVLKLDQGKWEFYYRASW